MKEKCIKILENSLKIVSDMDGYKRFSGEAYMAYRLDIITEEEWLDWLEKAADSMRKAHEKKRERRH